jgi:hypothetical protein
MMSYIKPPKQDAIGRELFDKYLQANWETVEEDFRDNPLAQTIPCLMVLKLAPDSEEPELDLLVFEEFGENRYRMLHRVGMKYGFERQPVAAVYLTSEAWLTRTTQAELDAHPENRVAPSEDPDRIEIVMVFGMALAGHTGSINARIRRDGQGRATLERIEEEPEAMESRLLKRFFMGFAGAYLLAGDPSTGSGGGPDR